MSEAGSILFGQAELERAFTPRWASASYSPGLNPWPRRAHGIISSGFQSRQAVIVIYHDNRKSTGVGSASYIG